MELYEQLKSLVAGLEDDFTKFYDKSNKLAIIIVIIYLYYFHYFNDIFNI